MCPLRNESAVSTKSIKLIEGLDSLVKQHSKTTYGNSEYHNCEDKTEDAANHSVVNGSEAGPHLPRTPLHVQLFHVRSFVCHFRM